MKPISMPGPRGDSFSALVIRRILRLLLEYGELKKSVLCGKAGINYAVCTKYVRFLAILQWIEVDDRDKMIIVKLHPDGEKILHRLESSYNRST